MNSGSKNKKPYSDSDHRVYSQPSAADSSSEQRPLTPDSYRIIGPRNSLYESDEAFQRTATVPSRRISREVYLKETNIAQREALLAALNAAMCDFLSAGRTVFLEGLGIFSPITEKKSASYTVGTYGAIRDETTISVAFEKCDDSNAIDRSRFLNLTETGEIAQACMLHLPPELCVSWLEKDVRRYLRGLWKDIRHQLIMQGFSDALSSVGLLFALHNRQGDSLTDWFAGADIGLKPLFRKRLAVGSPSFFERPVLADAFELLEAAFGSPVHIFKVDLPSELEALGYEVDELASDPSVGEKHIPVAVFELDSGLSRQEKVLLYCTNGLRSLALSQNQGADTVGTEVVFQLAISSDDSAGSVQSRIPRWIARPIAMAWVLLQSTPRKNLKVGAGLSCDYPLRPRFDTELNTIFLTPFKYMQSEVLSQEGPFRYINMVGITEQESAIARNVSQEYLLLLLRHKGLDQVTRATRTSITHRLEFARAEKTATRRMAIT